MNLSCYIATTFIYNSKTVYLHKSEITIMEIKKILVIRFRRVGDATLSVTLCTSLRKSFPQAEIHYVLNENIAPLFTGHPDIDKIITFNDHDMDSTSRYLGKVRKIMKEGKYDIIIDTRATMKTMPFALFSLRTPYRIGRKKGYNRFVHNYRVDNYSDGKRDNVLLTLDLLNPLSQDFSIVKDPIFRLYALDEEKRKFGTYLESKGIDLSRPIIVCAVTARVESKIWSKEKMKEILHRMLAEYKDAQLIFNYGGEREKAAAVSLFDEMGNPSRIFIDIEAKNLNELRSLLALSDFYFGIEGGPRHISQALGTASLAIFPPNIGKTYWLPNPDKKSQGIELADINEAAANDDNLSFEQKLDLIDVESVWSKLDEMLQDNLTKK